jgi:UDP-GlcNAc:undecaprenyl-phosphate GlcNAc-1-phosphate transferase
MRVQPLYYYLLLTATGFLASLLLTPLVRRVALATGRVAIPKDTRWHKKETALLGGVAIFISTVAVWVGADWFSDWKSLGSSYLPMILCAAAMFGIGLADDIVNMDPQHKIAAQIVITSILMIFGFRLEWTISKTANFFISIVWIIGITNAFNLLDNMDGLSAGVAAIATIFLFLTNYIHPDPSTVPVLLLSAAYLGALCGFLVYNFNPASIFMGDAGSLFIGFVIGCLTAAGNVERTSGGSAGHLLWVIAIPIFILFVPILDTGFVSFMRKLFRRPISQGGRDHSSHRMVAIGFSEKKAVLVLYAFSAASGCLTLSIHYLSVGPTLVLITLYLLFVLFFWVYLARVKVYQEESLLSNNGLGAITPIIVQLTYRRRVFEVFLDFILVSVAYYTAYLLRFEGPVYYLIGENFRFFLKSLPILLACQIFCFYVLGVYRGVWENTSISDLIAYIKGITAAVVLSMGILLFVYRFQYFSRVVFILYWILMLLLVSLSRLSFRIVDEGIKKGRQRGRPTLIYGAGVGGQLVAKEIENNRSLELVVVGFIDDNPRKHKRTIMGYPVLGDVQELERIIKKNGIKEIIISFRNNGEARKREMIEFCRQIGGDIDVKQMKFMIA